MGLGCDLASVLNSGRAAEVEGRMLGCSGVRSLRLGGARLSLGRSPSGRGED